MNGDTVFFLVGVTWLLGSLAAMWWVVLAARATR